MILDLGLQINEKSCLERNKKQPLCYCQNRMTYTAYFIIIMYLYQGLRDDGRNWPAAILQLCLQKLSYFNLLWVIGHILYHINAAMQDFCDFATKIWSTMV